MSRFIQRLLGPGDVFLAIGLNDLEKHVNYLGVDAKLIGDILNETHKVMKGLRLDPNDTTAMELYQALVASVKSGLAEDILLNSDYSLVNIDGEIVSLNLIDVIENSHHQLSFRNRSSSHGRRALKGVIVERYLESGRGDRLVIESTALKAGLLDENIAIGSRVAVKDVIITKQKKPYLLAIGDIVTDAFIALKEDQAEVTTDKNGKKTLSMEFGSKPPYDHADILHAVGNSANAAVAFSRLELESSLMAFIGDDQAGKDSLEYLENEGVDTSMLSIEEGKKTNYHYVLRYGADRTILIKYEDYNYNFIEPKEEPSWIYLSMISKDSWRLHKDLLTYLDKHKDVKLAFQPGTFHFEWGVEKLKDIYARSYVVVMNKEEAGLVTGVKTGDVKNLLKSLHELGPDIVVVTDGPDGAYAFSEGKMYKMPNYPDPKPPYDRTGAGDAFASTIVAALALGEDIETALTWAPINSMSVVQQLGAQAGLLNKKEIEKWLKKAPNDYKLEEIG